MEFGFGPTCKSVVEDQGAAYALLWPAQGDMLIPTEHYETPERQAFLKIQCGDDKTFGSASYGLKLSKNESAIGRVWARGRADTIDEQICLKPFAGGVLEWDFGPSCRTVVEDEGAAYAQGDTITPSSSCVISERAALWATLRGDDQNFDLVQLLDITAIVHGGSSCCTKEGEEGHEEVRSCLNIAGRPDPSQLACPMGCEWNNAAAGCNNVCRYWLNHQEDSHMCQPC